MCACAVCTGWARIKIVKEKEKRKREEGEERNPLNRACETARRSVELHAGQLEFDGSPPREGETSELRTPASW